MIKLRCVVEHITYQNPENGWSVMKVKVKGYDNLMTLIGVSVVNFFKSFQNTSMQKYIKVNKLNTNGYKL
ncbi:hypothetical protein [Phocaeicola sartorii]|uniref:YrrC family ATP-dependent DNA helicase n=1 Tax=Phocaeicola sartorii TaxID=671267 RepID=UPI001433DF09|nr:hypothetical protein [Phocaeicola sartorii]GFI66819.1 hypothetical protein IMSAG192_00341 [Muribaculaceae bacterium]